MSKRKTISQKTRFEVFKRDSFTCQYCGGKAPDVVLEVDHIKPVSKGGEDSLLNYATSCWSCNRGKSDRELSDSSVVEKQRRQIEELNERRLQLEMMLEWRNVLNEGKDMEVDKSLEYFNKAHATNLTLTDHGKKEFKKHIKQFGIEALFSAIDIALEKYSYLEPEDRIDKLGGILRYEAASPIQKQIMYINGIAKGRFQGQVRVWETNWMLESLLERNFRYDYLVSITKTASSHYAWVRQLQEDLDESEQ